MISSVYLYVGVGVAAVVAIVLAVVLTKWRRRETQGDDELLSEMATHLSNLPPLTSPTEEAVNPMTKLEGGAASVSERCEAQSKAHIASVVPPLGAASVSERCQAPEPAPVESQKPRQGPRRMGRHHLLWEVVDAGIDWPGVWPPESEAVERPVEQTRRPTPHAGTPKPTASALKGLDGAASNLTEPTPTRVEGEELAALETFSREVDARLQALGEGQLSPCVPEHQAETAEQPQGQINQGVEGRHPSLESASESRRAGQGRLKEQLDVSASGLVEQTRGRLRSEVAAALETFSREVDARLRALEQEPSIAKLRAEMTAELQKQLSDVQDAAGEAHQNLRQCADASVEKIDLALETAAGTFEHQTKVRLGEVEDALRQTSDDWTASAVRRLEEQVVATGERVTAELRALQTRLMDEVDKQVGAAIQAPLESLNRKAEAFTEECRRQLRQELEEGVRKGRQELETDSRKFLERQRELVQSLFDKWLATTIQDSRESLKREAQAIMAECRGRLLQEADAAAGAPKREAEREKLPMKPREPGLRPLELYRVGPPDPSQESTQLHEGPGAFLREALRAAVWLIPVAPILVFVILSIRLATHLRADPPAEFFEASPDSNGTEPATEERLTRAYWDSAVQYVQLKYAFGTNLPLEPVPEFKAERVGGRDGNSKDDPDTQRRYWRRLRRVWVLPQAWEQSYVWDTGWIDEVLATLQRVGR